MQRDRNSFMKGSKSPCKAISVHSAVYAVKRDALKIRLIMGIPVKTVLPDCLSAPVNLNDFRISIEHKKE